MDSLLDHLCRFTVPAPYKYRLETFLESLLPLSVKSPYGSSYFPLSAVIRICLYNITFCVQRAIPSARVASAPLSFLRLISRYWNINQLSIDSASRLRLRSGLTLIRLSLIRNPWSFGVRVSFPHYRYLCLHLLFCTLQHPSRVHLQRCTQCSPTTRTIRVQSFGGSLDARSSSTQLRSTSELLRTL